MTVFVEQPQPFQGDEAALRVGAAGTSASRQGFSSIQES
jgi:hypothetical protein